MFHRRLDLIPQLSLVALVLLSVAMMMTPSAVARTTCSFTLGFKALHDLMPDVVGDCLESEQTDPATGNLTQRTTNGLLMWRKADNWTAFTDGPNTYIARPEGVVTRPTDGPRLPWEPRQPPPPSPVARSGGQRSATAGVPETVLFQDNFDNRGSPLCRLGADVSDADFKFECVDGELRISGVDPPN